MHNDPNTIEEYAENIAELADGLGINNKTLAIVLPNMSTSRISRLVKEHKAGPEFAMDIQYAYDVLLEAHIRGALPVSPRTRTPAVLKLIADMIVAETKFAIMTEQHGNPGFDDADDLVTYQAIAEKAATFTD